jgi:hypothetical protein
MASKIPGVAHIVVADDARRRLSPGLEPKTVVNTHRMLHRAWEDFATWGWAKRNVVSDAHPPRVPRKGRKVWTVTGGTPALPPGQAPRDRRRQRPPRPGCLTPCHPVSPVALPGRAEGCCCYTFTTVPETQKALSH